MTRAYLRTVAILGLFVVATAACSSTNKADLTTREDTTSAVAPAGTEQEAAQGATSARTRAGRGRRSAGGGSVDSTSGVQAAGAAPARGGPVAGRGGKIKIGFHYSENLDTAYRAFGAQGEFVNIVPAIQRLVAYVNKHGGVGGRQVEPVLHGTDPLNGTFPAQAEEACTYFAEDQKVSIVVSGAILPDDNMPACHARHNIPLVWDYQYLLDRRAFEKYANHLYMPHMIGTYRFGFYVDALAQGGYFDRGAKIGLVRYDQPVHKAFADAVVKPGLARRKLKLTAEAAVNQPHAASEAGETTAQVSNAILRFQDSGVTHVLFVPSGGAIPLVWGAASESQGYFPRLAFNSLDIPNFVTDNLSDRQLDRAVVVGWMPANDTYMQYVPKDPDVEACKVATGVRDDTDMVRFCDGLFFLKAAFDRTPRFGVAGLRAAVEALGDGFGSPWSLTTRFGPGRHDGASSYRMMLFTPRCSCFLYTGSQHAVP